MQPLHSDRDHMQWLEDLDIKSWRGVSLLDVGCGSGYLCHHAMEQGAKMAVGIDIVEPKGLSGPASWRFINTNLNAADWSDQFSGQKFDLILAFDILEHLDSPYKFLENLRDCLSTNGQLVLTTPNLMSWERYARPQSWSGVQDKQHKVLFTRYSLKFLLSKVGLRCAVLKAPLRKLGGLGPLTPQIGGQIVCVAERAH